ncbi:MAG: RNA polymerase sigma factor [candidate division Zixibacteria bacterium]
MKTQNQIKPSTPERRTDDRFSRQALAHRDSLMRLARKLTGDNYSAEDLIQDTYLKAFKAFDNFEGDNRCRAWLKKIMINTYINMYNRKQKIVFYHKDNGELSEFPGRNTEEYHYEYELNEEKILHNFVCDEIRISLLSLPAEYRAAVILYDMLGYPYREISEMLSLPIGTVKSRLFRGRKSLKESLMENPGNGNGHKKAACG